MKAPEPPALPEELERLLRRMRLPYLRRAAAEVCATTRAQRWDPTELLRVLLLEEVRGRDHATCEMRKRAAGFPAGKTLQSWGQERSAIPPATQRALMTLEWISRAENLVVCGPSGTGKSHLCEALGRATVEAGLRVAWFSLESLTNTIARAKVDASVAKVVTRICRADLITIDLCRPRNYADSVAGSSARHRARWPSRDRGRNRYRHSHRASRKARTESAGR